MENPINNVINNIKNNAGTPNEQPDYKIPYKNLKKWIAKIEKLDEIRIIKKTTWQKNIGITTKLIQHNENAPYMIFDKIPDYKKEHRVLINFFNNKRKNITLNFPLHFTKLELSQTFLENYIHKLKPIPHQFVNNSPVFENTITKNDIDITKFPIPI